MFLEEIVNIFSEECNYKKINEFNTICMRNHKNGIRLVDVIYYLFQYSKKDMTKERIVSYINIMNKTNFTRQAFENKSNNVPIQTLLNIFHKLCGYYNSNYNETDNFKIIGIDGTYNNNSNMDEMLNIGIYDITNKIPIDLVSFGKQFKNKEISAVTRYIKQNLDIFTNTIIVGDRGYFSYDFIDLCINL